MDTSTSLSICRAIGMRLRDDIPSEAPLPPQLQALLAALSREEPDGPTTDPDS